MPTKAFPIEFLEDTAYYGKYHVESVEGDDRRWSRTDEIIFRDPEDESKLYTFEYEVGLTEMQENEFPWGYSWGDDKKEDRTWDCSEVEKYEEVVTLTKYRPV